jgi:predicted methyltransferase
MKKERKELVKNFKAVIEDLLDNYDKYTEEEKAQIKEIFQKVADLNKVLDKYDVAKEGYWSKFFTAYGQFFDLYDPKL